MGMSVLLDTHVVAWLVGDPDRVDAGVRATLADPNTTVLVSAISALEVATKNRLGKWPVGALAEGWVTAVDEAGLEQLPVDQDDALLAGSLTWDHRDPFDRVLAAQALRRAIPLVTVDRALLSLSGLRTITW